jgi:hypothetical protein
VCCGGQCGAEYACWALTFDLPSRPGCLRIPDESWCVTNLCDGQQAAGSSWPIAVARASKNKSCTEHPQQQARLSSCGWRIRAGNHRHNATPCRLITHSYAAGLLWPRNKKPTCVNDADQCEGCPWLSGIWANVLWSNKENGNYIFSRLSTSSYSCTAHINCVALC